MVKAEVESADDVVAIVLVFHEFFEAVDTTNIPRTQTFSVQNTADKLLQELVVLSVRCNTRTFIIIRAQFAAKVTTCKCTKPVFVNCTSPLSTRSLVSLFNGTKPDTASMPVFTECTAAK